MALMYALGSGLMNLYLTLGFLSWANTARLIRGTVLQLKEQEYIQACRMTAEAAAPHFKASVPELHPDADRILYSGHSVRDPD